MQKFDHQTWQFPSNFWHSCTVPSPSDKKDPSSHAICIVCTFRYLKSACARASKLAWSKGRTRSSSLYAHMFEVPVPKNQPKKWQNPKKHFKKCWATRIFNWFWGKSKKQKSIFFPTAKVGQVSKNCYEWRVSRLSCTQVFSSTLLLFQISKFKFKNFSSKGKVEFWFWKTRKLLCQQRNVHFVSHSKRFLMGDIIIWPFKICHRNKVVLIIFNSACQFEFLHPKIST